MRAVRNQERAEGPVEVLVQVGGKEVDHEQQVDETVDEMDGSDSGSDDLHMGGQVGIRLQLQHMAMRPRFEIVPQMVVHWVALDDTCDDRCALDVDSNRFVATGCALLASQAADQGQSKIAARTHFGSYPIQSSRDMVSYLPH